MKIYKTMVAISGDPEYQGQILRMDTIQYEGKMWLVAMWLDSPSEGFSVPERIICLDTLPHSTNVLGNADFLLNDPIPKSVLEGRVPEKSEFEYVVIERIICLDTLPHQISGLKNADFLLTDPIPKSVLDGRIPEKSEFEYVVIERPNLKVPRIH